MHREEGRDRRNGLLGGGDAGLEVVELGVGAVLGCSDGVDDMRRSYVGGGLMALAPVAFAEGPVWRRVVTNQMPPASPARVLQMQGIRVRR